MNWLEPVGARILPGNFGPLRACDAHARVEGSCGDTMEYWVSLEGRNILQASFTTDGCMTSVACGSAAAFLAQGRDLDGVRELRPLEILEALGIADKEEGQEAHHCADLALTTLSKALDAYEQELRRQEAAAACQGECGGECCEDCGSECDARQGRGNGGRIKRSILVMSGKGGVGKSTVAVNLAMGLAAEGLTTGLLDADVHGPSVPKLLGLDGESLQSEGGDLLPVELGNLKVISMGFALDPDQAAIMRGPMKAGVVDQFVTRTRWEDLDALVVDCPPGTGDEHLTVRQALGQVEGAVIITTPQEVATLDARKAITFCRAAGIPILGIVENMGVFACPSCGAEHPVFRSGGGKDLAETSGIPFLGSLPLDPAVGEEGDAGRPRLYAGVAGPAARAFRPILEAILEGAHLTAEAGPRQAPAGP